jgi:hypothetical protein
MSVGLSTSKRALPSVTAVAAAVAVRAAPEGGAPEAAVALDAVRAADSAVAGAVISAVAATSRRLLCRWSDLGRPLFPGRAWCLCMAMCSCREVGVPVRDERCNVANPGTEKQR